MLCEVRETGSCWCYENYWKLLQLGPADLAHLASSAVAVLVTQLMKAIKVLEAAECSHSWYHNYSSLHLKSQTET